MVDGNLGQFPSDLDPLRAACVPKTMVAQQAEEIPGDGSIRLSQNQSSGRPQGALQQLYEWVKVSTLVEHVRSDHHRIGLLERRGVPVEIADDRPLTPIAIGIVACKGQR